MIFTIKYRPKNFNEIVGQRIGVEKLLDFLKKFPSKKSTIIYGPPGIGKTAVLYPLKREYEVIQLDTSKTEKTNLQSILSGSLFGKKKLIFIDEVDNSKDLSKIKEFIEKSNIPIVMTANDAYLPKLREIRSKSQLIEFKRIPKSLIKKHLEKICENEGIKVKDNVLDSISEEADGDLRAAMMDLYSISLNKKIISKEDLLSSKRLNQGDIFKTIRKILVNGEVDTEDIDTETIIQWLVENVPKEYRIDEVEDAYEYISIANIFMKLANKKQYYYFKWYGEKISIWGTIISRKHEIHGFIRYSPPKWILYLYKTKQKRSMIKQTLSQLQVHCSKSKAMRYFYPFLNLWTK